MDWGGRLVHLSDINIVGVTVTVLLLTVALVLVVEEGCCLDFQDGQSLASALTVAARGEKFTCFT